MVYDKIILGAGLYGLYSAVLCAERGEKVLVLEADSAPFKRATYINQARVHMGYHYPRSYSTAIKSAGYFERFVHDFGECIHSDFKQIYATGAAFSWTNAAEFSRFCKAADIPCEPVAADKYFNPGMVDGAFLTREYTYDAAVLKNMLLRRAAKLPALCIKYLSKTTDIKKQGGVYRLTVNGGEIYETPFLLNACYASINQILNMLGFEPFKIKYELCEIILCDVADCFKDIGLTVMDGPFFSIMPFGKTGMHSLTSVTFTPHTTSYDALPTFECQKKRGDGGCSPDFLANCNDCPAKPQSAWPYMSQLAKKYVKDEYAFSYKSSLFSMKPILKASEIDDSRPTVIKRLSRSPDFVTVLSGKINTIYDLEEALFNE